MNKLDELKKLGLKRQAGAYAGYENLPSVYETDFVTPITKSACNVDSLAVFVLQDWSSSENTRDIIDPVRASLGYTPGIPTNVRFQRLLASTYSLRYQDVYITNLFPFIKMGNMSTAIPMYDLDRAFNDFFWREILVVDPKFVVCLGQTVYQTFKRNLNGAQYLSDKCFKHETRIIYGISHPAARISNSRRNSEWQEMKRIVRLTDSGE